MSQAEYSRCTVSTRKRNAVTVSGADGPALLFAHGLGCSLSVWHYISPRFARTHKLVLIDFVGFGASDIDHFSEDRYSSLQSHANDLIEVCQEFCPEGVTLVGHSLGGMISVLAASQQPELFAQLILLNVSPCHRNHSNYAGGFDTSDIDDLVSSIEKDLLAWSAHLAPVAVGSNGHGAVISELEGYFCRNTPQILAHQTQVAFNADIREDLNHITTPCAILRGWDDPFVSEAASQCLIDSLPQAETVNMMTSGHYPHLNDPEVVTSAIRKAMG
jgi:sigma-B regulation protein RsbQ